VGNGVRFRGSSMILSQHEKMKQRLMISNNTYSSKMFDMILFLTDMCSAVELCIEGGDTYVCKKPKTPPRCVDNVSSIVGSSYS
jgi:hypothetical protein